MNKYNFKLPLAGALLAILTSTSAHADLLFSEPLNELDDPSIINSRLAHNTNYGADKVFDNDVSGNFNGEGNVYATGSNTYASGNAFIDFDFGVNTGIGGFVFYQRGNNHDTVHVFNLVFANDSNFTDIVSTLSFGNSLSYDFLLQGDNVVNHTPDRQEFAFASHVDARYVRWQSVSSETIYDGAAEMEFWGSSSTSVDVPLSSSISIMALGLMGLSLRRKK